MADDETGRLDRELNELLQELRVTLPGVQVLFAFLLTVPFAQGFTKITSTQKTVFFVAFITALAASAFLLAPAAYHRVQWRQRDKERLLRLSTAFTLVGLGSLAVAMTAVTFVVTDVLYQTTWAALVASAVVAGFVLLWFVVPVANRIRSRTPPGTSPAPPRHQSVSNE